MLMSNQTKPLFHKCKELLLEFLKFFLYLFQLLMQEKLLI